MEGRIFIDIVGAAVNVCARMDLDDAPSRPNDALTELIRQDLDPLSVAELEARITALEGEIVRTRKKMEHAVNHRAIADQLFRS
jgi:uncharacterized small protein (DUF1192 family)